MSSKQRDRGRILTSDGLSRLQQAIRAWELEHEVRCTQERIKELTSAVKEGGLDPGTIRKILKAKDGVDPESILCLFTTFGLQLAEADLVSSSRLQIQADPNFVGRDGAIADLKALVNREAKVIVIQARGGVGKTTLARKYLQQEFGSFLEFPIAKETKDIASIESLIEEKLRQLGEEPGREFFVSLDRLKRKLQDERIGILIDNLEPALDSAGKFIEPHRRYVELLRVLTDPAVQSVTLITSRERLRESSVTVEHYMLKSLDIAAWEQFFQSRNLATDTPAFAALHNAYGGNAKAMDIIRGAILEDYAGDVAAYWQTNQHDLFIERDLEDLVTQQFDRLHQIDPDAYNLLCRMGCYRYQDVPTVSIEGLLCLLWDVLENRQKRVVKSLQDRSLVEIENGEYWLHPVIRSEAIGRLRKNKDLEEANYKAAAFWTEYVESIDSIKDLLMVFESCFHFLELGDFESAGKALLAGRISRLNNNSVVINNYKSSLIASFYRFGLFEKMTSTSSQVVKNISVNRTLCLLLCELSDIYLQAGETSKAIRFTQDANRFAEKVNLIKLQVYSLYMEGICRTQIWDISNAAEIFERVQVLCKQSVLGEDSEFLYRTSISVICNLSFLYSCLNMNIQAKSLADQAYASITTEKLGIRGTGYRFINLAMTYTNLEDLDKASRIYISAIEFAEKVYFPQIKAKAFTGLAIISRKRRHLEQAMQYHANALSIFKDIEAKFDISETYHQIGLTYQAMDEFERSNKSFQEAIRLFEEMETPKQVERVRRSMQTDTNH